MPLTAYSISARKELDVQQLLERLSNRDAIVAPRKSENIPDSWKSEIRADLECPSCFIVGAEIVREANSRSSGKVVRQACFRFSSPAHHALCDFAQKDSSNTIPENLVALGSTKSALTRAVGDLVCAGIHLDIFNQKTIRDMREWFFQSKSKSSFVVTLDPRTPKWIDGLRRYYDGGSLPETVNLTKEIASIDGFDWRLEARRVQRFKHGAVIKLIKDELPSIAGFTDRVEVLAKRYGGQIVFDPSILKREYEASREMARFISQNYAPIFSATNRNSANLSTSVLALAALLLYVSDWDMNTAISRFAKIATAVGHADRSLGNVMGLNPFHDYEA